MVIGRGDEVICRGGEGRQVKGHRWRGTADAVAERDALCMTAMIHMSSFLSPSMEERSMVGQGAS